MKTAIVLLGMILVTESSYGFGSRRSSGTVPSGPAAPTQPAPPNSDVGTGGLNVAIREANYFNSNGVALLEKARALLEKVVNSEEFKQKVIHFTYQGEETYVQNGGLTNLQIYNKIMAGAEEFPKQTESNHTMDLYTELYTSGWTGRNVIGYTNPSTATIFMNSYFFNYATADGVAGNMIHEWLHKLGFDHDYNSTSRRPYSVPYAVGYIAEELAAKYK
jgi:hypothetical protein